MSTDDRLDRLEQRVGVLEHLIRQLVAGETGAAPPSPPPPPPQTRASTAPPPPPPPLWPDSYVTEPRSRPPSSVPTELTEQWLGQRGLLAIGVLFVILAAGYLLKYSFDQGWVSPLVRCIGGALAGVGIGVVGWRLYHNGLRTYGAALVGCGAAVIYLAVWAASRLYGFLPPPEGVAALALVSLALAAVAFAVDVEALGATAVVGAFLAPILLGHKASDADLLLIYLSFMAFTLGWVSARKRWRLTSGFIALSYFGLAFATGAADHADPWRVLLFGVLGGSLGLHVGLREGWWETRFLSFTGGWGLLSSASERIAAPWAVVLAAVALAVPVWRHALRTPTIWPSGWKEGDRATPRSVGEMLYFFTTPFLLAWAVHLLNPSLFRREPGLVPLIVAVPYLVAGYVRVHPEFALVGTTAAGFAALLQWSGLEAVWALLALSLLWAALDHALARNDGRWYGLLALTAGLLHLVVADSRVRPDTATAFVDGWALTLWAGIGCLVVMARGLLKTGDAESDSPARGIVPALWAMAGVLLFWGVTRELPRFFGARGYSPETANLVGDEAIVVWWLLFFGALLVLGVVRALRPVRALAAAGLLGAALFLCYVDLAVRGDLDPAFWGVWAGALWLSIATLAGLAAWMSPRASEFANEPLVPALWIGAGVLLLLGVTGELGRFFRHRSLAGDTAALWTGLSVSVWWILFACGLVLLGFRRDLRMVRQAGLLVAAMAAVKIILHDLSSLNALYRVASVLVTGLVSLLLAYIYNRKARDAQL
jgi:uncharacterized membrane protein